MKNNGIYKLFIVIFLITSVALGGAAYYYYTETLRLTNLNQQNKQQIIAQANNQIIAQKKQKNEIADIFDDQAALNDDIIDSQRDLVKATNEYLQLIEKSVRFVNGEPQLFPSVKEEEFLAKKNGLIQKISELQRISEENATKKERNADRINQIYLDAKEDRNNTANEREGFR